MTENVIFYEFADWVEIQFWPLGVELMEFDFETGQIEFSIDLDLLNYLLYKNQGRSLRALLVMLDKYQSRGITEVRQIIKPLCTPNEGRYGFPITGWSYNLDEAKLQDLLKVIPDYSRNPYHGSQLRDELKSLLDMLKDDITRIGQSARLYMDEVMQEKKDAQP